MQSQLHHFHHLIHPQSDCEHSSSPSFHNHAAAEVISVHFPPGNAKIATYISMAFCCQKFGWYPLQVWTRQWDIIMLCFQVFHPASSVCCTVFPYPHSPHMHMCVLVRACFVSVHKCQNAQTRHLLVVTGVCVIYEGDALGGVTGSRGLVQPLILMGADVWLLWHSSIIMKQHRHHSLRAAPSAECGEIKCT